MTEEVTSNSSFSWKQFWISFVYENMPPVFGSPIAAIFFERSFRKAWNVSQHRNLAVLSTRYNPISFILISWLVVYPGSWIITLGFVTALVADIRSLGGIDPLQMMCAYAFIFCRRLIISVKYGYFTRDEYAALSEPAPEWNFSKTQKKLIAVGWTAPKDFPGLMEGELAYADRQEGGVLETLQVKGLTGKAVELRKVVRDVLDLAYNLKVPTWHTPLIVFSVSVILISLIASKLMTGGSIFGTNIPLLVTNLGTYFGILTGMGIMGFGLMCGFDFQRRRLANVSLDSLLLSDADNHGNRVVFDRSSPDDLKAWMSARRLIRSFGERFYFRVQTYTSILLCFSIIFVALLNFLAWTQVAHHVSTIFILCSTILVIAFIASYAIYRAMQLQQQSYAVRSNILDHILELEVEEATERAIDRGKQENQSVTKDVLKQIDENINFTEIIHKPTSVLGYRADNGLIGSVLGILVTGMLLALQGFVESGVVYSANGWAVF